jgi:hypothetical protein
VAAIVGARDESFIGVASSVTFGAYRVFGCKGGTSGEATISAMERAYLDNMDIINISLSVNDG